MHSHTYIDDNFNLKNVNDGLLLCYLKTAQIVE